MKIVMSHPTGNANVRAIAKELAYRGILAEFNTTIATFPGSFLDKVSRLGPLSELRRRSFDPLLEVVTKSHPWLEFGRIAASKANIRGLTHHEKGLFCVDSVYRNMDRRVGKKLQKEPRRDIRAVYAYEDGALDTFIAAKKMQLQCIYDLPIAYWQTLRELLMQEVERMPAWKKTLGGGIKDSQKKLERKTKELELADVVIGPGSFVIDSLPQWAMHKKLIISPFGSPEIKDVFPTDQINNSANKRPLRVLFAGSLGQRKGLGDLFSAMRMLKTQEVELVIMGSLLDSMEFYRSQYPTFTYEPGRPHQQVLELMRTCDVFCLPSIVEGRALVMQEAMSQGLPIIVTQNTGGKDLVIEGKTGFLIPIRSPESIAEKIEWFSINRSAIKEMGEAAKLHATSYTWKKYSETIVNELINYLG